MRPLPESDPAAVATAGPAVVLDDPTWKAAAERHAERADALTRRWRENRATGRTDEVEEFLYTYYPTRLGHLRHWNPGVSVGIRGSGDDPQIQRRSASRWHITEPAQPGSGPVPVTGAADVVVRLDGAAFFTERARAITWHRDLLTATSSREGSFGCLGLHEWAMVYRDEQRRHGLPLRLGQKGTDAVVESHRIQCTHFDAYRFFTPQARPLNTVRPGAADRIENEQPACLHANMDLYRVALKLGPAVPGDLLLDAFELARDIRVLDMEASPYDVTGRGYGVVAIETAAGKAEYIARQRAFATRSAALRRRLADVCDALVLAGEAGAG